MLGPQLTLLVLVSFLVWRLRGLLSLPHLLLKGLTYYVPLPDSDLFDKFSPLLLTDQAAKTRLSGRLAAGLEAGVELKMEKKEAAKIEPVPKKIVMPSLVTKGSLEEHTFYPQYDTVLAHCLTAALAVGATCLYFAYLWDSSKPEVDLSPIWISVAFFHVTKVLLSILVNFGFGSSEFKASAAFALLSLVLVLVVLSLDGHWVFQFGIEKAYQTFENYVKEIFKESVVVSKNLSFRMTYFSFRLTLAFLIAFLSATLMFPIVRFTRCYQASVKLTVTRNPLKRLVLHLSLIMPLFLALSWIPGIFDGVLTSSKGSGDRILLSATELEHTRLLGLFVLVALKLLTFRTQIQAFLNSAVQNIQNLEKESGQISLQEYQKKILPSFHYTCVACVQLLGFPFILLLVSLALVSLGGFSFFPTVGSFGPSGSEFFRPVLSFLCWWLCVFHFMVSIFTVVLYGAASVSSPAAKRTLGIAPSTKRD